MGRGRGGDHAVDGEEVVVSGEDIAQSVDGGEVSGDLFQSLEGGMKPSRSALAPALTCCCRLFLTKEALDTVIWTSREMRW